MSPLERSPEELRRRAWWFAALPPLALAVLYVLVLRLPTAGAVAERERGIAQLAQTAPAEAALGLQSRELATLTAAVEAARAKHAERTAPAVASRGRTALERAHLRERLSALFQEHSLVLVSEERGELDVGHDLAAAVADAGWSFGVRARIPIWTLELRGDYLDMLAALEALADPELPALPLRVELRKQDPNDGAPTWTLVLA